MESPSLSREDGRISEIIKKYRVVLTGPSAVKIGRARWTGRDHVLVVRADYKVKQPGSRKTHVGLIYTFDASALNSLSAIERAAADVRSITDEISAIHRAAIDVPKARFAINMDSDAPDRELTQVFYNAPSLQNLKRPYDKALYQVFFKALDRYRAGFREAAKRIDRALHFLRNSHLEADPIDRFEDAWVGIETINPLIRDKHKLATTYPSTCKTCGSPISAPIGTPAIEYLIGTLLGQDAAAIKRLRNKRIDIVHARASFNDILAGLGDVTVLAQRALLAGILDLLEVPPNPRLVMLSPGLPLTSAAPLTVTAVLRALPVDVVRKRERYPQLILEGITTVIPNREGADANELRPLAMVAHVGLKDFSGEWDVIEARAHVPTDPEEPAPPISFLVEKSLARNLTNQTE